MKKLLLSFLMLLPILASADTVEIDGLWYKIIVKGGIAEVTRDPNVEVKPNVSWISGDVTIPEKVSYNGMEYTVTKIGDDAFDECKDLTSITIPNSVTSIGAGAFMYCSSLTSITIPNSVTSIGTMAFRCCGLTSVTIPNSVTSIGSEVFWRCRSLTSVNILNGVTNIGFQTFYYCDKLTSINLPSSLKTISSDAFDECRGLTSVHITDLAAWCRIEFASYNSNPLFYAHHLYLNGNEVKDLVIPNGVASIGKYAFSRCNGLTSVTFPNGVTSIGYYAFEGCSGLTSVRIPNSVTNIGSSAFSGCSALASIYIGSGVNDISSGAFSGCDALNGVFIYDLEAWCNINFNGKESNPLYYGHNLYLNSEIVFNLVIPNRVTRIDSDAFHNCSSLTSVTIPNSVTSIGSDAFHNCSSLTSITIPNSVTSIGENAFEGCSNLISVTIPSSVYGIDDGTFKDCESLSSVIINIPSSRGGSISRSAFENCRSLTSIKIPDGVKTLGVNAFKGCSSLITITIPQSVKMIMDYAFSKCDALTDVYCMADGNDLYTYTNAFDESYPEYITLHVPAESIDKYRNKKPWKNFKNIVPIGEDDPSLTPDEKNGSCGEGVNYAYDKATHTLTISGSGEMADYEYGQNEAPWFSYADEIQKIEIESGITSIGNFVFYQCSNATSLSIPATVEYIGSSAFEDCTSLTSLTLNEGLLSIGGSAFENCTGLQTISIPSTVNAISINAFKNCTGITDVYCYAEKVPDTHFDAFDATPTEKATLNVPASAIEAYRATAPWSSFKSFVPIGEDDPSLTPDEENGSCGEGINYSYDKATQTLTISGSGEMADYEYGQNEAPWFSYADEIQKIEIESGITSIGYFAFYQCSNVTSLSIPATVGYIGSSAFEDCTSLTSLTLNEGLLSIGGSAFENCTGLQTLSIPSTVNAISINAFKNCTGITDVYCYAENVPETHFDAFDATPTEKSTLHVPSDAVEVYRASWPWSDFKAIVVIGSRGDANGDGVVDDKDVNAITDYIVKGKTEGFNFNNADANGDQKVNAADIVCIINVINSGL